MAEELQTEKENFLEKQKRGKARSKQFGKSRDPPRGIYWSFER